jgi:hypothetical protein
MLELFPNFYTLALIVGAILGKVSSAPRDSIHADLIPGADSVHASSTGFLNSSLISGGGSRAAHGRSLQCPEQIELLTLDRILPLLRDDWGYEHVSEIQSLSGLAGFRSNRCASDLYGVKSILTVPIISDYD